MVSYGTAIELGLMKGLQRDAPTTAYLFLILEKCRGGCLFCPQSAGITERISRVDWPEFPLERVMEGLRVSKRVKRACIQCADEEHLMRVLPAFVERMHKEICLPVSVSMPPASREDMERLKRAGVEILTIAMDCANRELFRRMKGRDWDGHWEGLKRALEVFGFGRVGTHIIVGLGEEERDVVGLISECHGAGIVPSLFAFTPIQGTMLWGRPQPDLSSYRRLQLARELIMRDEVTAKDFVYDSCGRIREIMTRGYVVEEIIERGEAFMTRGCPSCNRPYFNEKVSGPIYNYPRRPKREEIEDVRRELFGETEGLKIRNP